MDAGSSPDLSRDPFPIEKAYNNPRPLQKPHPPIMLGGSGSKLLKIAAAEADILNLIPPIFNGKDLINDPAAAVKFDQAELKRRIGKLQRLTKEAGRNPRGHRDQRIASHQSFQRQERGGCRRAADRQKMGFPR